MVVPTIARVTGISNMARMINGIERNKFTTLSSTKYNPLFSRMFPSRVTTSVTPKAIPKIPAIKPVNPTMINVSNVAF